MIDSVRSEDVVIVSNTYPDSGIIQTILLLGAIRDVRKEGFKPEKEFGADKDDVGGSIFLAIPPMDILAKIKDSQQSLFLQSRSRCIGKVL